MRWQDKLTKKELKHIKETTTTPTLAHFKTNRKHHNAEPGGKEPCYECRHIAIKLGLEE